MQRVDFLGAPGVGKSTLYRTLLKRRNRRRDRWLTPEEAKILVARKLALRGGWKKKLVAAGLYVPHLQRTFADYFTKSDAQQTLRDNHELGIYLELWEKALASIPSSRERVPALVSWVYRTEQLALLAQYLGNRVVLYDESYSKLVCGWLARLEPSMALLIEFFRTGPVPAAVVWLKDPKPDRVAQRLVKRVEQTYGRDAQGHLQFGGRRWREDELSAFMEERVRYDVEAARVLGERGVPVLHLDVRRSLTEQAEEVEGFLSARLQE